MTSADQAARAVAARRREEGLTLVEMLAVLALVSLLSALLIQGVGHFLGQYAATKRIHREVSLAALREHWFASTVHGMVPSRLEARRFIGDPSLFEGVTLQPLARRSGMPVRARWSIGGDDANEVRYTEERGVAWTVFASHHEGLVFEYADSTRKWHARWPLAVEPQERIPRMVRLVAADGRTLWLARLPLHPEPVVNHREEL